MPVGEAAAGILLGAAAAELLKFLVDARGKVWNCKKHMQELEMTLNNVIPRIEEVKRWDGELMDRKRPDMDQLTAQLVLGKVLVQKCTKIRFWSWYKKYQYSKKFIKLDKDLLRFFQLDMQAEIWTDTKELLVRMQETHRKLDGRNQAVNDAILGVVGNSSASAVPQLPALTVGMEVPLKELKSKLFQVGVSAIGLCAPGGCGKTTLAAKLCRDQDVKDIFKEIYFVTVSSSPDLKAVVQTLFREIAGPNCNQDFRNEEDALKQLGDFLKKKEPQPTLVVLDDVWSKEIVQKFKFGTIGYKVIITSRTDFGNFDSPHYLKMLGEKDARTLFNYWAFPEDGNHEKPDESLVNQIVEGCKGFPLTLKVIGNSLLQQQARKWQSVARMLSKGSSIFRTHTELLDCLSPSLDLMDPELRECFLDLGSFPEDSRIPAAALIDMWIELYGLDENDAYVNLLELSIRSLANLIESARKDAGDVDGYFNELFVTQHDLLRDLAIYKSQESNLIQNKRLVMDRREDGLPKIWEEHKDQVFEARIVSIHTGEMDTLSWFEMEFPNAEVLILKFSGRNYCLPPFLKKMEKLKVLIITNDVSKHAKLNGFPPVGCLPNLRRIRLEKISVPSLDEIKDPLKNLEKLSLVLCDVGEAMRNCTVDRIAIFPKLTEIDFDYCNDLLELPIGICELSHLQKLSITNCHNLNELPEKIDHMKDVETLRLHACTKLKEVPNQICRAEKLEFLDISECLNMVKFPEDLGELHSLRKIDMRQCSRLRQLPKSALKLKNLKEVVVCDEETAALWGPLKCVLTDLEIKVREEQINLDWLGFDLNRKLRC